jgi:hypothetical protein
MILCAGTSDFTLFDLEGHTRSQAAARGSRIAEPLSIEGSIRPGGRRDKRLVNPKIGIRFIGHTRSQKIKPTLPLQALA